MVLLLETNKIKGLVLLMIELTILMPCLNEENTIGRCIEKAQKFIDLNNLNAEIVVVDNGSTDKSIEIINSYKEVTLYNCNKKGYGNKKQVLK